MWQDNIVVLASRSLVTVVKETPCVSAKTYTSRHEEPRYEPVIHKSATDEVVSADALALPGSATAWKRTLPTHKMLSEAKVVDIGTRAV